MIKHLFQIFFTAIFVSWPIVSTCSTTYQHERFEYTQSPEVPDFIDNIDSVDFSEREKRDFLRIHNNYRRELGIAPLEWDDDLSSTALQWAFQLAQEGQIYHSHMPGVGENIYWGMSDFGKIFTLSDAAQSWASEKMLVHGRRFDHHSQAGHYTQMIWRNTQKVGAAVVRAGNNFYIVAHYWLAGNWVGQNIY